MGGGRRASAQAGAGAGERVTRAGTRGCGGACGRTLRARCAEGPESRILRTCAAAAAEPRGDADSPPRWMSLLRGRSSGRFESGLPVKCDRQKWSADPP
jgi:hypothetical protein